MMRELVIGKREIRSMLAEKSFLLIILLEVLLVSSSSLLSVGYGIITSPESSGTLSQLSNLVYVGVVTNTQKPFSQVLTSGRVNHKFYGDYASASMDLRNGIVDAILMGDLTLTGNRTQDVQPSVVLLFLPSNTPKAPLIKLALKKVLVSLEGKLRDLKVGLYAPELDLAPYRVLNLKPDARRYEIYFIFTLPLLLFLPCVISGSLAIDSITQDMESKRMLNLTSAPLTASQIVFGKALASLVLSLVQTVAWLIILGLTFVSPQNHAALVALCGLYTIVFINAGTGFALVLRRMKASQVLYTFVSMSAISLFSPFANIHPLLLAMSPSQIITRIALGAPPAAFWPHYAALLVAAAVTTVLVLRLSERVNV